MSTEPPAARTRAQAHTENPTPHVSDHAKLRWLQRAETVELTACDAWLEGYYVACEPVRGKTRLHPPTRTALVERDGTVVTVIETGHIPYTADHLVVCDECGLEYQPTSTDRSCPWCADTWRGRKQ
jgi:hypothetical protein